MMFDCHFSVRMRRFKAERQAIGRRLRFNDTMTRFASRRIHRPLGQVERVSIGAQELRGAFDGRPGASTLSSRGFQESPGG